METAEVAEPAFATQFETFSYRLKKHGIDVEGEFGRQLLVETVDMGPRSLNLLVFVLALGVPVDARDERGRPAFLDCHHNTDRISAFAKAGVDPDIQDRHGRTLLHHLSLSPDTNEAAIRLLASLGARADIADRYGGTAQARLTAREKRSFLDVAPLKRDPWDRQAAIEEFDLEERIGIRTWLHFATRRGREHLVELLLALGADPDVRGPYGRTPLHMLWNHHENGRLLLEFGANVHARDRFQNTPLHLVASRETAEVLIEYGADPQATNKKGKLPADLARGDAVTYLRALN